MLYVGVGVGDGGRRQENRRQKMPVMDSLSQHRN